MTLGQESCSPGDIVRALRAVDYPLEELTRHPVSTIENIAAQIGSRPVGVCGVDCLGCCANSVSLFARQAAITPLTPGLLAAILRIVEELVRDGIHILSTVRLTLYNASNELDGAHCIALRQVLSEALERIYGFPLGAVSSDLAMHVSKSPALMENLSGLLAMPTLWDNICLSIDEQIPLKSSEEYRAYLERLSVVWALLGPALKCELDHAKAERRSAPRVVLNMLVPEDGAVFRDRHRALYPGGPLRAVRYQELIDRYVKPFVGDVVECSGTIPAGHKFTSGFARLARVPGSLVYVAYSRYAPTGRGSGLVRYPDTVRRITPGAIRTKIFPVSESSFTIRASFTTVAYADDEVPVPAESVPSWFRAVNGVAIDAGRLLKQPENVGATATYRRAATVGL